MVRLECAGVHDLPFIMATERLPGYEDLVGRWDESAHQRAMADGRHAYFIGHSTDGPFGFAILRDWNSAERVTAIKRLAVTMPDRGDGRALLAAVVDAAFTQTQVYRLWLGVFVDNLRARRAYESVGFGAEGIARGSAYFGGTQRDELIMSILRPKWQLRSTAQPRLPRLSVNLNKIALLRNSRRTGVPDVLRFARLARDAGADGITVHPRPDERHIRRSDVLALANLIGPWRPHFELNLEGYPDKRFLDLCGLVQPEQCTIVPDPPTAFTSEEGWKLKDDDRVIVSNAVTQLKAMGSRVIVFVDPDATVVERVPFTGADGIEVYTGNYAAAARRGALRTELGACTAAARTAADRHLLVNIGHDLNLENLPPLVNSFPSLAEASIGHEVTADALEMGFERVVVAYKAALRVKV